MGIPSRENQNLALCYRPIVWRWWTVFIVSFIDFVKEWPIIDCTSELKWRYMHTHELDNLEVHWITVFIFQITVHHHVGKTDLCIIRRTMTGNRYWDEVLHPIVCPHAGVVGLGGPDSLLMDDSARPHRPRMWGKCSNNPFLSVRVRQAFLDWKMC